MFYKSRSELDADWHALFAAYQSGYAKLDREYDIHKALQNSDAEVLSKSTEDELAQAKSAAAGFEHGADATISYLKKAEAFARDHSAKFREHNKLRERSKRFFRRLGQAF